MSTEAKEILIIAKNPRTEKPKTIKKKRNAVVPDQLKALLTNLLIRSAKKNILTSDVSGLLLLDEALPLVDVVEQVEEQVHIVGALRQNVLLGQINFFRHFCIFCGQSSDSGEGEYMTFPTHIFQGVSLFGRFRKEHRRSLFHPSHARLFACEITPLI